MLNFTKNYRKTQFKGDVKMKMSDKGRELLKQWEGVRNKVYLDSAGLPTIGCGHLLTKDELTSGKILICAMAVPYKDGLLDEDIDRLLAQDLAWSEGAVNVGINCFGIVNKEHSCNQQNCQGNHSHLGYTGRPNQG